MDHFETFLDALEELVDARDDAWIEEENCNYKQSFEIKEKRIEPARQRMREAFNSAITDIMQQKTMEKQNYFISE